MTEKRLHTHQNLYRPEFEHDACGIGMYAHLKGKPSHDIVQKSLEMLCKMDHRGGQGSDNQTGDGSGIMLQIPHDYFQSVLGDIQLPEPGTYGVGMIFLPQDKTERQTIEKQIENMIEKEGQKLLGWRTVPVADEKLGLLAKKSQPCIRQLFVGRSDHINTDMDFERKLYVIRKQLENHFSEDQSLYFASFSSKTIVYKGLLTPEQLGQFYIDLQNERFQSAFALVHNRFSTNTFPSWERAHPNRFLVHNGEINTLRGNVNWMRAREKQFKSTAFGEELEKVKPIMDLNGSDSSILDNAFEFFVLAGRKPAHVAMMLIPEPWTETEMEQKKKSFYEYHSCLMEPWDGPTAISFTDGKQIGAILDRNGLRPARYYVTKDDHIIFSSEVGVIDIEPQQVLYKDRLSPGKMLLVDLEKGRIVSDQEIKDQMAQEQPYDQWLSRQMVDAKELPKGAVKKSTANLIKAQKAFGYTYEDLSKTIVAMIEEGKDPIGSMGNDVPLAVLSDRPQSLFNYFKQIFAQVTNPPIDAIREKLVTSTMTLLGSEGNILHPDEQNCRRIRLDSPFISNEQLAALIANPYPEFQCTTLPIVFKEKLEDALEQLFEKADEAIDNGSSILILSDRNMDENHIAIPSLLAGSALHQHLVRQGTRTKASIIMETGEVREVHHFAALIGYGVDAVNPYLSLETIDELAKDGTISISKEEAVAKYLQVTTDGVVKVLSKMGISTIQSYRGAQIFEALGIGEKVIDRYFTGTPSQLGGITLEVIEKEAKLRHEKAYKEKQENPSLDTGSELQWRKTGEHHAFNPKTIHTLQQACRRNDYRLFKEFSTLANEERITFLRNLFEFNGKRKPVPLEEVESPESIVRRFKTGAMSFGALSEEAHEALAIAMNRLGAKSNSGEGGEDPDRFTPDENGDLRRSAIKQIASGRFGVKSHYLVNADELQIKMAQGAKPGEGGQLPGKKVYPWVAKVRGSTPGVELISPPPHHDIYSIEDLAQLIHDLKNANRNARISVKLVSKSGVGTIAAGVAKGNADVIVVSGYDGGTGASPKTSIKHAGLPWELGLAETHQTLMLNGLRDRVVLETDGKLMTGRDVVMAALLGAEEFAFATAPLVVLGCVMMRACHLDTCPVGIATQNPELRKKFMGSPDHIVNYMMFIAEEVREIMAELGFRTIDEMVGRTDVLNVSERAKQHWKARYLDLSRLLYQPEGPRTFQRPQDHKIEKSLDVKHILPAIQPALENKKPVTGYFRINNTHRVVGTAAGSEVTKRYGEEGLRDDTIRLHFTGSAGQSFGAYVPKGMTLDLTGDANDYVGKGLSGGKIIVKAPKESSFIPEENVIIGNVAFYGATSGEAYIQGLAGERFCVRNSGVKAVVEGVGDHGCEYMTGGRVVILGSVGKNFAAGMSGGVAYVYAEDQQAFKELCNTELVLFETLEDQEEMREVQQMIQNHYKYTESQKAARILANWHKSITRFIKVIPKNYKQMIENIERMKEMGLSDDEAALAAYEESFKKPAAQGTTQKKLAPVAN